jgi:hypothetical protein
MEYAQQRNVRQAVGGIVGGLEDTIAQAARYHGVAYDVLVDTVANELKARVGRGEGRFSEGQEAAPDTPEKVIERRFSEGQEDAQMTAS